MKVLSAERWVLSETTQHFALSTQHSALTYLPQQGGQQGSHSGGQQPTPQHAFTTPLNAVINAHIMGTSVVNSRATGRAVTTTAPWRSVVRYEKCKG